MGNYSALDIHANIANQIADNVVAPFLDVRRTPIGRGLIYTLKWPLLPCWSHLYFLLVSCCSSLSNVCQIFQYYSLYHSFALWSNVTFISLKPQSKLLMAKAWFVITSLCTLVLIGAVVCGSIVAGALLNPCPVCVCRGEGGWKCLPAAECNAGHHPGQRRTAAYDVHSVQGALAQLPTKFMLWTQKKLFFFLVFFCFVFFWHRPKYSMLEHYGRSDTNNRI